MSDDEPQNSRNGIQVIARAAAILRVLKTNQTGLSLGQVAELVDLPRSTVQRIVGALQNERMVVTNANGRGLRLGPEVSALAEAARDNIVELCRLFLVELAQDTGETADLSVMRGAGMNFLDQVPGIHRLRTISSVGDVFPLTTTANGKSCLSQLPPDHARDLTHAEWDRRGIKGNIERFMENLDLVRRTGLAYDLEQHTPGISAIGFSFRDYAGDLHAISVPVPTMRFEDVRPDVEAALSRTKAHIEKALAQP